MLKPFMFKRKKERGFPFSFNLITKVKKRSIKG